MGSIQENVKSKTAESVSYKPALVFIRSALDCVFSFVAKGETNSETHLLLITTCNFLGSCTFLLTCIDMDTILRRDSDFSSLFPTSLSFLFQALLFPNADVAVCASKAILKLTTQGKNLLLIPYVEEMSLVQSMIQLLCPLLTQNITKLGHSVLSSDSQGAEMSPSLSMACDDALLTVLEAIIRLLVQLPPRLADSYISSIGNIALDQLDKCIYFLLAPSDPNNSSLEAAVIRSLRHICRIIKFCDVLFMPPLQSPGKGVDIKKPVDVLLPFLGAAWSALQRAEEACLRHSYFLALDEIFSVYSVVLFSCRDVVAISELPRLGEFIVTVFKQWRRASAAKCATTALESLVVIGPEVRSTFFVPLVCSMAMTLPERNAPLVMWSEWSHEENDTTGGVLEAYLTLLHRCVFLCPEVLLSPFSAHSGGGVVTFRAFDIIVGQIFSILNSCTEISPLKSTLMLVQCMIACPNLPVDYSDDSLSVESSSSRDTIIRKSVECIGEGIVRYILYHVSNQRIPSMLWSLYIDTLSIVFSSSVSTIVDGFPISRQWVVALLSDSALFPFITHQHRSIVLDVLMKYPVHEKRRFKLFMHDLSKICAAEQGPETLLDYALSV